MHLRRRLRLGRPGDPARDGADPGKGDAGSVMAAMLKMKRISIDGLKNAYAGR